MMRFMRRKRGRYKWCGSLMFAVVMSATAISIAHADNNDLVVSRLGIVINDDMGNPVDVVGDPVLFRSLASELGVIFAPRLVEPADTLGFSGFQFAVDAATTSISSDQPYWRVLESSTNPTADGTISHGANSVSTIGVFVRKGMWLPLPSFEVGAGVINLLGSSMLAPSVYAKFALHEGYHKFPLPSVAIRGGVSRLMGTDQIDLTIPSIDLSMSKHFGIAGTFNVAPFIGWNWLVIIPRSEVIDKTPQINAQEEPTDAAMNFTFADQDAIIRNRLFFGAKINYYLFTLGLEANFAFAGSSTDDRGGTNVSCSETTTPTSNCDATDIAGSQQTYTGTLAIDF